VGFDPAEHADLKLDEKKLKQLTAADKALIVDRYGQLAILDTKIATEERNAAEGIVENERRGIRARLKERPAEDTAGGDMKSLMGFGDSSGMTKDKKPAAAKKTPTKGKTNPKSGPGSGS